MNRPDERTNGPGANEPLTRGDVEQWRAEADDFFLQIRRELSCLTGESPTPAKRSVRSETPNSSAAPSAPNSSATPHPQPKPIATRDASRLDAEEVESQAIARDLRELRKQVAPVLDRGNESPSPLPSTQPSIPPTGEPATSTPEVACGSEPANDEDRLAELKRQIAAKLAQQPQPPTFHEEGR